MKLDRNEERGPIDGCGKYALINMRKLNEQYAGHGTFEQFAPDIQRALGVLESEGLIQYGPPGHEDEFFVVKLKDRHAGAALTAYADSIEASDPEFALEVRELATRAGPANRFCKEPD